MTATTRRLWLYAVLLLLPALAVGGLALGLLAREQARLAEREAAAAETRRAAVETRARLIAENIELLVGDVQSALMVTLAEAPEAEPREFLNNWRKGNALVRDVFRATAGGQIIWGGPTAAVQGWLGGEATNPAGARALARAASPAPGPGAEQAREEISSNVVQYQKARQELQVLARQRVASAPSAASVASAPSERAARIASYSGFSSKRETADSFAADLSVAAGPALGAGRADFDRRPEQDFGSGWTPWTDESGLRLLGWRRLSDGTVIGLELALDAIKARLGEVFPAAPEAGEAYELRDGFDRLWHRAGVEGLAGSITIPLAALPGWRVTAGHGGDYVGSSAGNVFALGAALVALLVFFILAAGGLLLRQARLSEQEAVLKTSFVANVSHELKTPLTTIRLYADLLAQGRVRDEAKRAAYLDIIGQETQRLGRLVGNVLDFSRLEQGKKKYERVEFDLAAELRRLAEVHGPRLAEAGLALGVETPESLRVATDRDAVEQIVLNLLDNACKYAAEGGEVLVALEKTAAGARIMVADRGPGVPTEQRERIFEKFHRVDERLTAAKGGAGLGLSIARQLARGLGGDLVCRAREGGGAEFTLILS
jgi:signal transduction histidine kinase